MKEKRECFSLYEINEKGTKIDISLFDLLFYNNACADACADLHETSCRRRFTYEEAISHYINHGFYEGILIHDTHAEKGNTHTDDINIIVKTLDDTKYFNMKTQDYLLHKPNVFVENAIVFVDDFVKYKNIVSSLYDQFLNVYCDILCPCLLDEHGSLTYFGGYCSNNQIELFDNRHYLNLNERDEAFYNKKTNIIYRNCFVVNSCINIMEIRENLNMFQFTELNAIVTPYVQIKCDESVSFDRKCNSGALYELIVEKEVIVENELLSNKYFVGNNIIKINRTVLICENSILTPSQDCGSKYMFEFIKLLIKNNFTVHFFSAGNYAYLLETDFFKQLGVYVHYDRENCRYKSLGNFLKNNPIYFDYIFLSRQDICHENREYVRQHCPSSKMIFITHDIAHNRAPFPESETIKLVEVNNIKSCDLSLIVSKDEMTYLKSINIDDTKLFYYPICYEKANRSNRLHIKQTNGLYFIGSTHTPNIESLNFFIRHIWPHIVYRDNSLKLHIIGSCGNRIEEDIKNVVVHGVMKEHDLLSFLDNVRVSIVPLLNGGGLKGKVLQSFNHGIPVISSEIGIQGMNVKHLSEVCIVDINDHINCAKNIVEYYNNITLLDRCSKNAIDYFDSNFSSNESQKYMKKMFQQLDNMPQKTYHTQYNCIIMCVVYNDVNVIKLMYDFFKKTETVVEFTFYFIINTELESVYLKANDLIKCMQNTYVVHGDNECHEFSGIQSTINTLHNQQVLAGFDSIVITNETLLTHFPTNHLKLGKLNVESFVSASTAEIIYGLIDAFPFKGSLNEAEIKSWVRSNFILMNMNVLAQINYTIQHFNKSILDKNNKCVLNISAEYENLIDNWLKEERYAKRTKEALKTRKTCILNEHYLGSVLYKFKTIDLR
tara:strand:+ start:616 stop:3282 length:2667 start_codon:yes stop_codon:yes gene_type:complete